MLFLLVLFKLTMVFPFVFYFVLKIALDTRKQAQLVSGVVYLLSMLFVVKYIFPTIATPIVFLAINIVLIYVAFANVDKKKKQKKLFVIIREYLLTINKYYKYIYAVLIVIGFIAFSFGLIN